MVGNVTYGTGFAQAGFTYDANLSPFNQAFSLAVNAVIARTPVAAGTSFVNITVTGTATIATLQVTTATIATENVSTATVTQLVVSQLNASGTSTFASIDVTGTATIATLQVTTATIATVNISTASVTQLVLSGVAMTATFGTFNGTGVGFTAGPIFPCVWMKINQLVVLTIGGTAGSSNTTSFSIVGVPLAIQPVTNYQALALPYLENNGGTSAGAITVNAQSAGGGTMVLTAGTFGAAASWVGSGIKGLNGNNTITYSVQ